MDITEPINEYEKVIEFYESNELKNALPLNPYDHGSEDNKLFKEPLSSIESNFEDICDEFVFAKTNHESDKRDNHLTTEEYILDFEKVIE